MEDRTSLHFLDSANGHFLGKRERLCAPKGNFGSNPGNSETVGREESPVFAGLLGHCSAKKQETALAGWGNRTRTASFLFENLVLDEQRDSNSRYRQSAILLVFRAQYFRPQVLRSGENERSATILMPTARRPVLRSYRKTHKCQRLIAALLRYREISSLRNWRRERNWDPTVSEFVGSNLREREEPGSNFPPVRCFRIGSDSGPKAGICRLAP